MALRPALLSATRLLIDEKDSDNSHFTDSELYGFLNQAIRYLGTDLEWPLQTAQATAVAEQAVYELPDDFISLVDVYFDNNLLAVVERKDLSTLQQDWQEAASGQPRYCYKSDNAKMGLWPKPSSEQTSDSEVIQIQYVKVPPDLADDTTAPDLHSAFHDCLPFYAAFLCELSMGNRKAATDNLSLYESHKKRLTSKVQRFADDLLRFRWPA
jgi:predicted metal-dependent hydrolase